jgi:hypothetical protein
LELERNLLAVPQTAHQRVGIYSGIAHLARAASGSEVRAAVTCSTATVMICPPTANLLGHDATRQFESQPDVIDAAPDALAERVERIT